MYPERGQRVLGWDVRWGHCIQGDRLSCYTGQPGAQKWSGVETALCLVKVMYCVGDHDDKTR